MEEENILQVRNLSINFKSRKIVTSVIKNISFSIKKGSIFCLVGESGSGKSVTANSIMQLLPRTAEIVNGSIDFFKNNQVYHLDQEERFSKIMRSIRGNDIAMIFQNPISSLNPAYTIGDQIVENINEHYSDVTKEAAYKQSVALLSKLGIQDASVRFHQYPHEFSGGMAQRVMIAMAMINNPQLLIADEPTTALDVTVQEQIMKLLRQMRDEDNKSILLITHNMGIVAENADEVAVMYHGRIVEIGLTKEIFSNPQHPYTKGLLNSVIQPGMNKKQRLATLNDFISSDMVKQLKTKTDDDFYWEVVTKKHKVLRLKER